MIRFGTFQLPASRGGEEAKLVGLLADYVIKHHYPELLSEPRPYFSLLKEVTARTAKVVSHWQCVGFVHGEASSIDRPFEFKISTRL